MAIVISSFTAGSSSLNINSSTTLTPVFTGGTGVILSGPTGGKAAQTATPVKSGSAITVTPLVSSTYALMVTATDGSESKSVTLNISVVIPVARKLSVSTGSGVVHPGTNDYFCNSAVYFIRVMVSPESLGDHVAHTNEGTIKYQVIINNTGTDPLGIIGMTNLNTVLAKFGLVWG